MRSRCVPTCALFAFLTCQNDKTYKQFRRIYSQASSLSPSEESFTEDKAMTRGTAIKFNRHHKHMQGLFPVLVVFYLSTHGKLLKQSIMYQLEFPIMQLDILSI